MTKFVFNVNLPEDQVIYLAKLMGWSEKIAQSKEIVVNSKDEIPEGAEVLFEGPDGIHVRVVEYVDNPEDAFTYLGKKYKRNIVEDIKAKLLNYKLAQARQEVEEIAKQVDEGLEVEIEN